LKEQEIFVVATKYWSQKEESKKDLAGRHRNFESMPSRPVD
jgi:hypothetical protein